MSNVKCSSVEHGIDECGMKFHMQFVESRNSNVECLAVEHLNVGGRMSTAERLNFNCLMPNDKASEHLLMFSE